MRGVAGIQCGCHPRGLRDTGVFQNALRPRASVGTTELQIGIARVALSEGAATEISPSHVAFDKRYPECLYVRKVCLKKQGARELGLSQGQAAKIGSAQEARVKLREGQVAQDKVLPRKIRAE